MWLIISLACSTQFGNLWRKPQAETNFDSGIDTYDSTQDTTTGPNPSPNILDALWNELDPNHCEGHLMGPGATGYFIGYYQLAEDDIWYGVEQHVLFSNGGQEIIGDDSCQTTWAVTGISGEVGACGACLFSLSVNALQDSAQSTCPDSIQESGEEWDVSYDILLSNGVSEFYFYDSGTFVAEGEGDESLITFVSDPICYTF